jgi:two-component sensor histidine kinase
VQKVRLFARAQQEIHERRRAEQALRQARDELELRVAERTAELTLLINASQTLISTLDQDELFERVLEELRNMLQVFACSVWLLTEDGRELICRQSSGARREETRGWRLSADAGVVGWVAREGRSLIVADAPHETPQDASLRPHTQPAARSLLLVPLLVRGRVIGVLQALDTEPDRFSESDMAVVESLAATAAFAIDNSRLYNLARQDAETKSLLLREVNHRVKNNLTAVGGLLYAEQRHAGMKGDAVYQSIMRDLIGRVQSLSTVHDLLSASEWQPISLTQLTERLIYAAVQPSDKQFIVKVGRSDVLLLPEHASKLALVVNELATNCLKYAAPEREVVRIEVDIVTDGDDVTILFADNGPGFAEDVLRIDAPRYNVGFHLVQNIISRMGGRLTLANGRDDRLNGALITIQFNLSYETAYSMGTTLFTSGR